MKLGQLVELKSRADLGLWNDEQKRVILYLIDKGLLTKKPEEIMEFGKFFSDYLNKYGETPTTEQAEKYFKLKGTKNMQKA
jgi:hypothetical protein